MLPTSLNHLHHYEPSRDIPILYELSFLETIYILSYTNIIINIILIVKLFYYNVVTF